MIVCWWWWIDEIMVGSFTVKFIFWERIVMLLLLLLLRSAAIIIIMISYCLWRRVGRWTSAWSHIGLDSLALAPSSVCSWTSVASSGYPLGLWAKLAHSPTHSPNIRRNSTFIYSLSSFFSSKKNHPKLVDKHLPWDFEALLWCESDDIWYIRVMDM